MARLVLKTGPAWPREPSLAEQLSESIARQEVLREECLPASKLPTDEQLQWVHDQLNEMLWRQRWACSRSASGV